MFTVISSNINKKMIKIRPLISWIFDDSCNVCKRTDRYLLRKEKVDPVDLSPIEILGCIMKTMSFIPVD